MPELEVGLYGHPVGVLTGSADLDAAIATRRGRHKTDLLYWVKRWAFTGGGAP